MIHDDYYVSIFGHSYVSQDFSEYGSFHEGFYKENYGPLVLLPLVLLSVKSTVPKKIWLTIYNFSSRFFLKKYRKCWLLLPFLFNLSIYSFFKYLPHSVHIHWTYIPFVNITHIRSQPMIFSIIFFVCLLGATTNPYHS